jgi:hypothetical protein
VVGVIQLSTVSSQHTGWHWCHINKGVWLHHVLQGRP